MTTKVIVEANHGWPVRVTPLNPETDGPIPGAMTHIVPADQKRDFYVHSGQDLHIHEIQPGEIEPKPASDDESAPNPEQPTE